MLNAEKLDDFLTSVCYPYIEMPFVSISPNSSRIRIIYVGE
jgi:hypothetical protein